MSEETEEIYNCDESKEIRICSNHDDYQVPLIWTYAFNGCEYWCPYCGFTGGMMGSGDLFPETEELVERKNKYKELSLEYLDALSTLGCSSLEFEGKRISPNDLPEIEKDRLKNAIDSWKDNVKLTE